METPFGRLSPSAPGDDHGAWCSPHRCPLSTTGTPSAPRLWLPHTMSSILGARRAPTRTTERWLPPSPQRPHAKGEELDVARGDTAQWVMVAPGGRWTGLILVSLFTILLIKPIFNAQPPSAQRRFLPSPQSPHDGAAAGLAPRMRAQAGEAHAPGAGSELPSVRGWRGRRQEVSLRPPPRLPPCSRS